MVSEAGVLVCVGRGQSDFSISSSALISAFDLSPSVHTFCLRVCLAFLSLPWRLGHLGRGEGEGCGFPKPEPGVPIYLFSFIFLERRGASLNLGLDFLLLIPFSQSKKPRAAHLGGEGAGTFGTVERLGQVSRLCEEGGRSGNS